MLEEAAVQAVAQAIRDAQRAAAPGVPAFTEVCRAAVAAVRAFDKATYRVPAAMTLEDVARAAYPPVGSLAFVVEEDDVTVVRVREYQPKDDPHRAYLERFPTIGAKPDGRRRETLWRELSEVYPSYAHACYALAREAEEARQVVARELADATAARDRHLAGANEEPIRESA